MEIDPLTKSRCVSCGIKGLGKDGGFMLLWSNDVKIVILNSNKNLIDLYIMSHNNHENSII